MKHRDTAGAETDRIYREQQAAQLEAMLKPAPVILEAKSTMAGQSIKPEEKAPGNPTVNDSGSTKPEVVGNPECRRCKLMKECRGMWKATHRKHSKDKPAIIVGIVRFVDDHAPDMVCLSQPRPVGDDKMPVTEDEDPRIPRSKNKPGVPHQFKKKTDGRFTTKRTVFPRSFVCPVCGVKCCDQTSLWDHVFFCRVKSEGKEGKQE